MEGKQMMKRFDFIKVSLICIALILAFPFIAMAEDTTPNYPIWLQHIAEDFEVEVDILVPLYNAGMNYGQIKEKMFEAASVGDVLPETSDYIALAAEKGIDRWDAVRAYELGVKYKKDPAWLADLYKEYKDWDDISSSLNRYVQIKEAVASVSSGGFNGTSALQAVGYVYNDLSSSLIAQIFNVVSNVEDLEDILFFYDLNKEEDTGFLSSIFGSFNSDYADMVLGMGEVTGLRTRWPAVSVSTEELTVPSQANQRSLGSSSFSFDEPGPQQFVLRSLDAEAEPEVETYSTTSSSQEGIVDMGIVYGADRNSPFKSYFSGSSESIDALTGELTMVQTDFTLPGKYGMDFEFTRVYRSSLSYLNGPSTGISVSGYSVNGGSVEQSKSYRQEASDGTVTLDTYHQEYTYSIQTSTNGMAVGELTETLTRSEGYVDQYGVDHYQSTQQVSQETYQNVLVSPSPADVTVQYASAALDDRVFNYLYTCFGFGVGWSLDIPMMEIQTDKKFVHLGVEGTYEVDADGYLKTRNLKDIKVQSDTSYTYDGATSAYSMTQADGIVWYFNSSGKPLAVKDKYDSYMRYYYVTSGDLKGYIDRIVDTVGRVIKFNYTGIYGFTMGDLTCYFPQSINVNVYESENTLSQPLLSWNYEINRNSSYIPYLSSVTSPLGNSTTFGYTMETGSIAYNYSGDTFKSYYTLKYMLMTSINHPNGTISSYSHTMYTEDRGSGIERIVRELYRVTTRYDTVPTEIVTSSGTSVQNKEENRATFTYTEPTTSNQYYINTKTVQRSSGETGMTPATETFKFNLESRLVEHEKKTSNGGENLNQTETVKTTYEYDFDRKSLPIKQTVSSTVNNVTSTKVHRYIWDDYGNQVRYIDPAGHITDYEYDYTYNMMTKKTEYMTPNSRNGSYKLTENILDADKKKIVTVKESMVTQSSLTQGTVEGQTGNLANGETMIFSPSMLVKSFTMKLRLQVSFLQGLSLSYKVSYRKIGTENWVVAASGNMNITQSETLQIKDINVTFPEENNYEIKIEKTGTGTCEIQEFKAYYDESVPLNVSQVIKTVEYDTNHPGNITAINVHQLYTGSPTSSLPSVESRTTYQYDSTWHADLVEEATVVTDVDGVQSTVKSTAQYDRLGRPTVITNQETGDLSISQTSIEYDQLGRVTKVTNPPHDNTLATTYRTYTYLDTQRKIRITDELGNITEETYDGMDRLVTSSWIDSLNQTHVLSHNRYDSLGNMVSSFDGNFNETKYEYDAFGRQVKTIWPDEIETNVRYADVNVQLNTSPSISLTPPQELSVSSTLGWTKFTDAEGNLGYKGYDIVGRLIWSAVNPKANPDMGVPTWDMTWYEYDGLGRVVKKAVNRTSGVWDITTYEYDYSFSAPSSIDLPGDTEPIMVYEYDSRGLKVKEYPITNPSQVVNIEYDELGRTKRITYPVKQEYINTGNTFSPTTGNVARRDEFHYDIYGLRRADSYANNILENRYQADYNRRGWITSESWNIDNTDYTFIYGYDAVGNRVSMTYPDNTTNTYEYDELRRMTRIPGYFERENGQSGFMYDQVGNMTDIWSTNGIHTQFIYNTQNMATSIASTPLSLSYTYSGNGNITKITDNTGTTPVELNYTYDSRGQLKTAQVNKPSGVETVSYSYDGTSNRISEIWKNNQNQIVSQYTYIYQPGDYLVSKGNQTSTTNYAWDIYGQLSSKSSGENYIFTGKRNLNAVTESNIVKEIYTYDALGRRLKVQNANATTLDFPLGNDTSYEVKTEGTDITITKYISANGKYLAKTVQMKQWTRAEILPPYRTWWGP